MIAEAFAHDLADNVAGLTYNPTTAYGNVGTGREMPSAPDQFVLVLPVLVPFADRLAHATVALQLLVRGDMRDEPGHDALCTLIRDHLDCHPGGEVGAVGDTVHLVGCTFQSETPLPLDASGRPEQSLNFRALIHHPTTHRSTS